MAVTTSGFDYSRSDSVAYESGAESGGTGDMWVWGQDKETQHEWLLQAVVSDDQSSYDVPSGATVRFNHKNSIIHSQYGEEAGAKGGGTGTLEVFTLDLQTQRDRLLVAPMTENLAEFDLPKGVTTGGFPHSFLGEMGSRASGTFLDVDGGPLTGTMQVVSGDDVLYENSVNGTFVINADPPPGVLQGADAGSSSRDLLFSPAIAGVAYIHKGLTLTEDVGTTQYGRVQGSVTDYNGNPVEASAVSGTGYGTATDENGNFALVAPGGESVTFAALDGTVSQDVGVVAGDTVQTSFTYPQLTVEVVDAGYAPIEGAPVRVNDTKYKTDDKGRIELPQTPLGTYDIKVMDYYTGTFDIDTQGEEFYYKLGPDASEIEWDGVEEGIGGIRIKCIDTNTKRPVRDVGAEDESSGTTATSGKDGVCKLLTPDTGDTINVLLATGDRRYRPQRVAGDSPDSGMAEVTVEMEPRTAVSDK
jgi:hypothetical protein